MSTENIQKEAEEAAKEQYPENPESNVEKTAIRNAKISAFTKGAEWYAAKQSEPAAPAKSLTDWLRADGQAAKDGWHYAPDFLEQVAQAASLQFDDGDIESISMEGVEAVIIALSKYGAQATKSLSDEEVLAVRVKELHSDSQKLINDFARALAEKMLLSQDKYGYQNEWVSPDWRQECGANMMRHVLKGDPKDVAIYCAFMWYHGWSSDDFRMDFKAQGIIVDDTLDVVNISIRKSENLK